VHLPRSDYDLQEIAFCLVRCTSPHLDLDHTRCVINPGERRRPAGLVAINPRRVAAAAGHGAIGAGLSCSASPVQRRDPRRCRAGVTHQLIVRLPVNVMTSRPSAVAAAAMNAALAGV
jgi:hypothetical protein